MQDSWLWPLLVLAVAALSTYVWRGLGVALSGRINPASPFFAWLACVAYALLAGLIARMVLLPIGPLIEAPLAARIAALAACVASYYLTRHVLLSILLGGAILALWLTFAQA